MNLLTLSGAELRTRPLNTLLNLLLLAMGMATVTLLLLFSTQLKNCLERDAESIDLVVGTKGSPLQLVLSGLYQLDAPTRAFDARVLDTIRAEPLVKQAIPLFNIGHYHNYRIIGTEPSYPALYKAEIAQGQWWQKPREVVLGAEVAAFSKLSLGSSFVGDGNTTGVIQQPYRIVGILRHTGTLVDRVILTSLETAQAQYDGLDVLPLDPETLQLRELGPRLTGPNGAATAALAPVAENGAEAAATPATEVVSLLTSILVQYAEPRAEAAAQLPPWLNSGSGLQAAIPTEEAAGLMSLLGIGLNTVKTFGGLLIITAALSLFITLYNALKARRYELAIMRTLGAGRATLFWFVLMEGLLLALVGTLLGLGIGHGAMELLGQWIQGGRQMALTGWLWLPEELLLFAFALGVGLLSALLPAIQAYRTDIADTLARG